MQMISIPQKIQASSPAAILGTRPAVATVPASPMALPPPDVVTVPPGAPPADPAVAGVNPYSIYYPCIGVIVLNMYRS